LRREQREEVPTALPNCPRYRGRPALSDLGFEIHNKFGAEKFDVLFSILMIETDSRRVRWIWKPRPEPGGDWRYESPDVIEGLGQRMIDAVLCSAVPLAFNHFGPPARERLAQIARQTAPEVAREIGDGYPMNWDS
jgi:hypothetical protein